MNKRSRTAILAALMIAVTTAACSSAPRAATNTAADTKTAAATATTDTAANAKAIATATTSMAATAKPAVTATSTKTTTTDAAKETAAATGQTTQRPAGWSEASHGNDADPDYAVVFPKNKVNQITITIAPTEWAAMQANATKLFGAKGTGGGGAGGAPADRQPPGGAAAPGGRAGGGGNADMTPVNPMWISATITFKGETWTHVGVRFKGNSTLTTAWRSGSAKLPLKLDFDQFEEAYPEIKNQRFYGFKQLSLANNAHDASYMRDVVSYDILEAAGLVTSETAYYEVILDYGQGPVCLGLYTVVEVVDDTVVERAFDDADGNIYEADGSAASLAEGTVGRIETSFQKENNEEAADWSDIKALYDVLHSAQRTTAPAAWRASLEAMFDVDSFLEWLAVNATIQDWDTYGAMSHNYYLYHDPETDQLVWISWDHNEALSSRGRGDTSLDKKSVSANWPLIRYLLDDPVYYAKYVGYLRTTLTDAFKADELTKKYDALAALIRPYVEKEGKAAAFDAAVAELKTFTAARASAVKTFLAGQK